MLCEKDRVFPSPRGTKYFIDHLPTDATVTRLAGLGHIPMLEAPGRVTELIADFVDGTPSRARSTAGRLAARAADVRADSRRVAPSTTRRCDGQPAQPAPPPARR